MRRIDAATAAAGDVVLAARQIAGKGQRGKTWNDVPGDRVLMSIILTPALDLSRQPVFLAAVAVAVAAAILPHVPSQTVSVKWPNDILIGDKKAAGILIENVVRGQGWQWAVVGIGLNVGQHDFPEDLPHATSMLLQAGGAPDTTTLAGEIAKAVLDATSRLPEQTDAEVLEAYNKVLYRRGRRQTFQKSSECRLMRIIDMNSAGQIGLEDERGDIEHYTHGSVEWIWE